MRIGQFLVDLQRTAKLERGFLKPLVFQERLPARYALSFGFFGGRARTQDERCNQDN
jgi:hypothetical protein